MIVTTDSPQKDVLYQKTEDIKENEFPLAQEIAKQLRETLLPLFPNASGLAAPQIGKNRSVFIFTYDRTPENLEVVINPSFDPVGEEKIEGWEGCLSSTLGNGPYQLAHLPRYKRIRVRYLNKEGKHQEKILEGFAAKVFQHEYDHLQGMVNIRRHDATVVKFSSKEEMRTFLDQAKKEDAKNYKRPAS